jgi:hypothetical protein
MGAKEKPGFMVTGNRILLHFSMSFVVGLGFSAVAYSLCAAYFLHGKKNGIYYRFFYIFFYCWLFSFELVSLALSLSLLPKKSLDLQ